MIYRNNLKNRFFGKEAPQNSDAERATIAGRQGASEHQNSGVKPTWPKNDSSGCFGIHKKKFRTLEVSSLGLGCMGMTGFYGMVDPEQCMQTIREALDNGITFLDTADNYGFGDNESLVGAAIGPYRPHVRIATKVGVVRFRETPQIVSINGTPEYIKQQCRQSLKRLGVAEIDLYYLHHLDPNTPIEESIHAMAELVAEGLVRHLGLGEMDEETIRRAHSVHPITAVQAEYSLFSREAEKMFSVCGELGIGFVACSPLCRGLLSGAITVQNLLPDDSRQKFPRFQAENLPHNLLIVRSLERIATEKSCTLSQLALAWVAAQSPSIVPLFGTTQPTHILENVKSTQVHLTHQDLVTIRGIVAEGGVRGERLPEWAKKFYPRSV